MVNKTPDSIALEVDGWRGELASGVDRKVFSALDLSAILDPDQAKEMLYWGSRNLLYRVGLQSFSDVDVAVKLTRNQGWWRKSQRRLGRSKAERSWRMALAFTASGVPTPKPVAWVESTRDDGPSLFVTQFEPGLLEARYFFRALENSTEKEEFPWLDRHELLRACGQALAQMHRQGFWHRDVSIGNLVVREHSDPLELLIVDLNRARSVGRLSWSQRVRDLCRLPLDQQSDQQVFMEAYLGSPARWSVLWLYRWHKSAYFGRIKAKKIFRRLLPGRHKRQHPHEHIPRPSSTGDPRDQATWDHLTDQPFQHASPTARWMSRFREFPHYLASAGHVATLIPGVVRRHRSFARERFRKPVAWPGIGIALGPGPESPSTVLPLLEQLGAKHVLLRVHPWQEPGSEVELAREIATAGYDLSFALPQNRDLVTDLDRWRRSMRIWGRILSPYGSRFQVGQAINRSKWGVWRGDEYADLVGIAREELPQSAELIGPAVIDFEPLAMASVLAPSRMRPPFSVSSSLLYVDRRGAPENRQMGLDAVGKATLMKAIGATAKGGSERLWVTEVNWPLAAGPHSPAGRAVSVDEEAQANYAVRYYVPLLASGMVERIYWWQLIARGYGLVDRSSNGELRARPAFDALATLARQLMTTSFEQRIQSSPRSHLYQFATPGGDQLVVGWCEQGEITEMLPRPVEAVFSRSGESVVVGGAHSATLSESPRYFWLQPE